jgi:aryl-alcohol dehydrogenase-like predicted oxidoreductase
MEYRTLGKSGLPVSSIGLGCVTFGREIDAAASFAVMDRAVERGITLFDTAEAYAGGLSEEIIGRWLAERGTRDQIVLATKVRPPLGGPRVLESAEASLRRLSVDTVDLFMLHSWDEFAPLDQTLEALDTLVRQGKAQAVGCSNVAAWQLCRALWRQDARGWSRMEAVQENYNLVVRDIERELLPLCADQDMGVITYSPLGGGFLTGKYARGGQVPAGARLDVVPGMQPIYLHEAGFRILAGLEARAAALGVAPSLLALAWTMALPGITSVLIGARTPAQVDQALAAAALGMTAELRAELGAL